MAKDANFSQVSLLLRGDGANGSTTVTDSSTNAHTLTVVGNAAISTAVVKFGSGSLYFDGAGDYLLTPTSAVFGFGTGDFTLEYFTYPTRTTGNETIIDSRTGDNATPLVLGRTSTGAARCFDGTTIRTGGTIAVNTWTHVAWCRAGTTNTVYVGGTAVLTFAGAFDCGTSDRLTVGSNAATTVENYQGYIDELRVTKGLARYTANFTPPTEMFPLGVGISGVVRDVDGNFAARTLRSLREDTGALVSETVSNATTGAYSLTASTTGAHSVVAYPAGGENLPALILRGVIPA